jgi:Glycosyltransferase family 87
VVVVPTARDPLANDFTLVFIGARIGLEQGWSHIYNLALQHQLFTELRPGVFFNDGQRYLAPPPLAWLTLPLYPLGPAGAFYAWTLISLVALVAAWWIAAPGAGARRWIWLLAAVAWYPVLYGLAYGQPALLVMLAAVVAWKLLESGRPYAAGVVLAIGMSLKPQLMLALPLVLLAAGRWRVLAAWAITLGVLAAASILAIGPGGLSDYRSLLAEAQLLVNNRYFTSAYLFGPGLLSYVLQAIVLAAAAVSAYRQRQGSTSRLFALAIVASAAGATYWHLQDFTVLLAAAWLFWRGDPPVWQRAWLVIVALTVELAWPLTPLPLLLAIAVWFAFMCAPERPRTVRLSTIPA